MGPRTTGTAKARRPRPPGVYPYRNRLRWFMFGRYAHLVRAARDRRRGVQDTVLDQRLASLRAWNSVRFVVSVPLTAGLVATVGGALANLLPGGLAQEVVDDILALSTSVTGIFTLAYLFLSRLLGQLEIDILALLTLDTD